MKNNLIIFIVLCISILSQAFSQDIKYFSPDHTFQEGEKVYLFGNNVNLRVLPNEKTHIITSLKIGTEVEIIEKTGQIFNYNGFNSPWYKVKYNDKTGYILGALISLEKKNLSGNSFLVTLKKEGQSLFALVRVLTQEGSFFENEALLYTPEFSIHAYDNKGLNDLENILHIDYLSEACGIDGGGIYFFFTGKKLIKAFTISQVSEASIFWYHETLTFPDEKNGIPGKILYKREAGETKDEEANWLIKEITSCELSWKENKLIPEVQKLDE